MRKVHLHICGLSGAAPVEATITDVGQIDNWDAVNKQLTEAQEAAEKEAA